MKRHLSYLSAGTLLLAAACTVEPLEQATVIDTRVPMEFTAGEQTSDTKTVLTGGSLVWSEGDAIKVFDGTDSDNKFSLTTEAGLKTGTFSGLANPASEYVAIYPYSAAASCAESIVTASLPGAQAASVAGTFDTMVNPAVAKTTGTNLKFYNVGAFLNITVSNIPAGLTVSEIEVKAEKNLSGAYTVDASGDGPYEAVSTGTDGAGVTLTVASGNAGPYFAVALTGEYTLMTAKAVLSDGSYAVQSLGAVTLTRNTVQNITIDATSPISLGIADADEFVAYMNLVADGNACNGHYLEANIDLSGKTLPSVSSFPYTFDGKGMSIQNWTTSQSMFGTIAAGASVSNLVLDATCALTIPEDATNIGFIANVNNGTISKITNNAALTLTNITAGKKGAICGVNNAMISECTNTGSITYTGAIGSADGAYYGGVAGQVTGASARMEKCSNTGAISFTFAEALTNSFYAAGVVGAVNSNAKALDCTNSGDITVRSAGSSSFVMACGITTYAGGEVSRATNSGNISYYAESAEGAADGGVKGTGVAGIAAYEGWSNGTVTGNRNTGDITLRAGYSLGMQTSGSAKKYATNVAGIFGHMYECAVDDCHNEGTVTAILGDISNSSAVLSTDFRQSAGGIVASSWGEISNCENTGTINVSYMTASRSSISGNRVYQVGGISGGDYHSDQLSSPITNCKNTGAINYTCDAAGPNNSLGGIVGWPSKENNTASVLIKGCENTGAITIDGSGLTRIGGIAGGATNHSGNINRGSIYLKGGTTTCAVGGVAGLLSGQQSIIGCENYGQIKSDVKLAGARGGGNAAIGGICGAVNNQPNVAVTGCTVNCEIIAPEGSTAFMLMGVVGQDKSSSSNVATIGTEASPNVVAGGTLTLGGTATQITSENFATYALPWGTGTSSNANVTSNVIFTAAAN